MKSVLRIFFVGILILTFIVLSTVAFSESGADLNLSSYSKYATNHFSSSFKLLGEEIAKHFSKFKDGINKNDKEGTEKILEEKIDVSRKDTIASIEVLPKEDDIKNIIVFGMDSYDLDSYKTSNCDSILVLTVKNDKIVKATSILRDTLVYIPDKEEFSKINTALVLEDSIEDAVGVVENVLCTKMDNYLIVNYQSVIKMVDEMGGMLISLKEDEVEPLNDILEMLNNKDTTSIASPLVEKAGYQYLDGKQTLAYMRIRKRSGDVTRVDRQKKVVKYLFRKASKLGMEKVIDLVALFNDSTVNNMKLSRMVPFMKALSSNDKMVLDNITLPQKGSFEYGYYKNMSVIITDREKLANDYYDFISE
jgi:LCP family protein required for cell wall assembly